MHLSSREILIVIKGRALRLNVKSVFILATIVDEEIAKTETSFLTVPGTSSNNGSFCSNYTM